MKNLNWPLYLVILLNLLFFTFCFSQKTDLHVDEIYSFGQANSSTGPYLFNGLDSVSMNEKTDMYGKWYKSDVFCDYMTVQKDEIFDYSNVVKNLSQGVHPPLFHMILHTVSSFFPDTFNIWQGYAVNLLILTALLFLIYNLAMELFLHDKKLAVLALAFCSFSLFMLNMAIYIRMYLLWMCLSVFLIYFTLKFLQQASVSYKKLAAIFVGSFLCFLTHFYALPLVFFLTASTCLWLLLQKRWKQSVVYGLTILSALALAYICFPYMFDMMLFSSRGQEFQNIAAQMDFDFFDLNFKFFRILDLLLSEIFNFPFLKAAYAVLFFILAFAWGKMQHVHKTKMFPFACWMLSFVLPFVIFLVLFSPDMGTYDDRYFSPILIVGALLIFYWLNYFLKTVFLNLHKRLIVLSLLILINFCYLNFENRSAYLFPKSSFSDLKEKVDDAPVFVLGSNIFVVNNLFLLLEKADNIFLFDQFDKNFFDNISKQKNAYLFVYVGYSAWMDIDDCKIKKLPAPLASHVKFLGVHQVGIYFYSVYQVK